MRTTFWRRPLLAAERLRVVISEFPAPEEIIFRNYRPPLNFFRQNLRPLSRFRGGATETGAEEGEP